MKRTSEAVVSVSTPKRAFRIPEIVPDAPQRKRVCFSCKREGHFSSVCTKMLRDVTPRCRIDLGKSLSAVVFPSKREATVHLRYYGETDDKPTQDGIALTLSRWEELQRSANQIDRAVKVYDDPDEDSSFNHHLGGNWYVSVTPGYRCVNIRRFWLPEDSEDLRATRDGIALGFQQWEKLMDAFDDVVADVPELRDVIPCLMRGDHQNQLGMLSCPECNPNDYTNW